MRPPRTTASGWAIAARLAAAIPRYFAVSRITEIATTMRHIHQAFAVTIGQTVEEYQIVNVEAPTRNRMVSLRDDVLNRVRR